MPQGRGVFVTESQLQLNQNSLLYIWSSDAQMNNYYADRYILSGMTMGMGSGSIRMGPPIMTVDPDLRLVLTQSLQINGANVTAVQAYRVEKLELIGIAKHETPEAYTVNRHPLLNAASATMNRGSPANRGNLEAQHQVTVTDTRPLTDFEKSALADIKGGKETVAQEDATGRIVVGAVRSQEECLQCHTCKIGDALGAFSYRLSKVDLFNNALSNRNSVSTATLRGTP